MFALQHFHCEMQADRCRVKKMCMRQTSVVLPSFFEGNRLVSEPGPAPFQTLANFGKAFVNTKRGNKQLDRREDGRRRNLRGHRCALSKTIDQLGLPIACDNPHRLELLV